MFQFILRKQKTKNSLRDLPPICQKADVSWVQLFLPLITEMAYNRTALLDIFNLSKLSVMMQNKLKEEMTSDPTLSKNKTKMMQMTLLTSLLTSSSIGGIDARGNPCSESLLRPWDVLLASKRASFMRMDSARRMKEANRFMWMLFLMQCSFLMNENQKRKIIYIFFFTFVKYIVFQCFTSFLRIAFN